MEQQLPMALQVVLYAAALALVVAAVVLVKLLFHFRAQLERVVEAVEELKAEVMVVAKEARVVVHRLGDLSGRAQRQWSDVEGIIDIARNWSERADHLVQAIGSVVEPPILTASLGIRRLKRGIGTFVRVLLNRNQFQQP